MFTTKATHEQLKRHNRQLLLRAVVSGMASSRASLAQYTGLAKPTVSDLIAELMDDGFLVEGGHGEVSEAGGKRPRLLEFVPNARQVIGVSMHVNGITGVLADLNGEVSAQHRADLHGATGEAALSVLEGVVNGLRAQLDAPLLCLGIGVAGIVDSGRGIVEESMALGWDNFALGERLVTVTNVPVHIGNTTELAARAQAKQLPQSERLVTLLINGGVEFGMVLNGGSQGFGSDIGLLELELNGTAGKPLASLMNLGLWVKPHLPDHVAVGYHARLGDPDALRAVDHHAHSLAHAVKWVIGLLRPDHIALVGPIVDYGDLFITRLQEILAEQLPPGWLDAVAFSMVNADHLSASGAVALAIQRELGIP